MVEKKDLVFVFDKVDIDRFQNFIKLQNKLVIVCSHELVKNQLFHLGFECRLIGDYNQNIDYVKKAIDWIKTWPDKQIMNGKSFKELLIYDGISIFWFLETRLYLYRIQELIFLIEKLKLITEVEKPENIWVVGSNDARLIISQLFPGKLKGFTDTNVSQNSSYITHKSYEGFPTLKILLLKIFRGLLFHSPIKLLKNNRILILTEVSSWRKQYDFNTEKHTQKDVFFHDIIQKLLKRSMNVSVIDFENRPNKVFSGYFLNRKRQKSFGVPVEPWEKYVDLSIINKSRKANKKFLEMWKKLRTSKEFINSLKYEKISLYEIINQDFDHLFKSFKTYTAITLIETAKKIVKIQSPSIILMHDEYGALQISLLKVAKTNNIPTISLQHGVISENLISYYHKPEHIKNKNPDLIFPIPDKICVWSEIAASNLINFGNFPVEAISITGDPKLDFLSNEENFFNFEKIIKKIGVLSGKKIILFATENFPLREEKILVTKCVFNAVKELKNCFLIIKMHPNELDISFYHKMAEEYKLTEYVILTDYNLYEILYVSDLVILSYSTVGLEAMKMKKTVISLNLLGLHDDSPLIKNEIAFVVRNWNELLPTIQKCLNSIDNQKNIEKAQDFAERQLGKIDGKAVDRIIDLILQ